MLFADILCIPLSLWISFWLRRAVPFHPSFFLIAPWIICSSLLLAPLYFSLTGQYKSLTRYVASDFFYSVFLRSLFFVILLVFIGLFAGFPMPPRSSWVLFWILLSGLFVSYRLVLRDFINYFRTSAFTRPSNVVIYGAGFTGSQLASSLKLSPSYNILGFIDDDNSLVGRSLHGVSIFPRSHLSELSSHIDQVLVAIPSLSRSQRRELVTYFQYLKLSFLQVPSISDVLSGRARIDELRPIVIEDLLGRDSVSPDPSLLGPGIENRVVCVTGCGGSIGSELCRQILSLNPQRLVLLDHSEPALYAIRQELLSFSSDDTFIVPVLADVRNTDLIASVFVDYLVDVCFHAAAYKHVPIVESNPLSGVSNNVLGSYSVCSAALSSGLSQLMLVSTDKAVRPTNIMGASKRLAEIIFQYFASSSSSTSFGIVRFGNVLGSSGSVVPLFRKQIRNGGPITLTHPEVTRFFMTIPEAVQLVLQAAVLSTGGEVFLLDMGEPVSINALARQMIHLSGLSVRDESNPSGDISIQCTGLRPGEKLYEELLIDSSADKTIHPLIYKAKEPSFASSDFDLLYPQLVEAVNSSNCPLVLDLLSRFVPEWVSAYD